MSNNFSVQVAAIVFIAMSVGSASVPSGVAVPLGPFNPGDSDDIDLSVGCEPRSGARLGSDLVTISAGSVTGRGTFCASSPPPQSSPLGDATWHVLTSRLRFRVGALKETIVVPRGFVTDFASVPRPMWALFPKDGNYLSAAILHDYLYWDQRCSRAEADTIFKLEMQDFRIDVATVNMIYVAVSAKGQKAWNENARARKTVPRVMPEAFLDELLARDSNADRSWKAIQAQLISRAIVAKPDPGNFDVQGVCRRATSVAAARK